MTGIEWEYIYNIVYKIRIYMYICIIVYIKYKKCDICVYYGVVVSCKCNASYKITKRVEWSE